jgi:hypothetical protein
LHLYSYGLSEGKPTEKGLKIDAQVKKNKKLNGVYNEIKKGLIFSVTQKKIDHA